SRRTRASTMMPLPTPPGPETTMISRVSAKLVKQGGTLLRTETLDASVLGDTDLLHDAPRLHLAHTGQGFQQRDHLQLAHVGVVRVERRFQAHRAHLEPGLDLGPSGARLGGLRKGCCPLLRCQLRRCSHNASRYIAQIGQMWNATAVGPGTQFATYPLARSWIGERGGADLDRGRPGDHQLGRVPSRGDAADA